MAFLRFLRLGRRWKDEWTLPLPFRQATKRGGGRRRLPRETDVQVAFDADEVQVLRARVLERAWMDLDHVPALTETFVNAWAWVSVRGSRHAFSFEACCLAYDRDPDEIRSAWKQRLRDKFDELRAAGVHSVEQLKELHSSNQQHHPHHEAELA